MPDDTPSATKHEEPRAPWQRTLVTIDILLFVAAQIALTVTGIGVHEGDSQWGVLSVTWPQWGVAAFVISAAWYALAGFLFWRLDDEEEAAETEPESAVQDRIPWRGRFVRDERTRLPGVRFVCLLTLPMAFAGFSQLPSDPSGSTYFNPGVFFLGWLLVILVVLLKGVGGAWPGALGVVLWLPWAWFAQDADEWPAGIAGVLGLAAQIALFVATIREAKRQGLFET